MHGHMTGSFVGGSHEDSKRREYTIHFLGVRSIHLSKLNPNCHMNYSIIFTEISFYPETSICQQKEFVTISLQETF